MTEATLAGLVILFIVVVWFRFIALESERLMAELLKVSTGLLDRVQQLESYHDRNVFPTMQRKLLQEEVRTLKDTVSDMTAMLEQLMSTLSREDKHAHTGRDPGEGQVVSSEADTGTSSS